jgi:hypothetical protein
MSSSTSTPEAIFIPIDLEASLGRIEEGEKENQQSMECEPITRTSSGTPFNSEPIFVPYPISETDDEIKERQRLAESVGANWSLSGPSMSLLGDDQQMMTMDFEPAEALMLVPEDDDDFSLSAEEAGSLTDEDFQLERIQDQESFWETPAVSEAADGQPLSLLSTIPLSVSFSSHMEEIEW